jgi:adenylosuccinate synthase
MNKIVIGLGFGDEGKGLVTSHLCEVSDNPMVVRFNGGHQAGHTVVREDKRHVFSTYGSGTLQGVPTYWSEYCTLYPVAVVNERRALEEIWTGSSPIPKIRVHPLAPVTVIGDVHAGQNRENNYRHGSVGVGFGQTIERHERFYKIYARDLFFEDVLLSKLRLIYNNYYANSVIGTDAEAEISEFMSYVAECRDYIQIADHCELYGRDLIFEGAQGVMLDQDFGFFPHVTRSNTTSKNAFSIISDLGLNDMMSDVYYVTRSYQTRHGNGPMTREGDVTLKNNEMETNKMHDYQGSFRTGSIDPTLLRYAIECDSHFSAHHLHNLVVTCLDQHVIDVDGLASMLAGDQLVFRSVYVSESPDSRFLRLVNR